MLTRLGMQDYRWSSVISVIRELQPSCKSGLPCFSHKFRMQLWQAFFKEHPEYVENDFYITGESYAGHYIPAFATRVHKGNKNKEGIHINLKVLLSLSWFFHIVFSYKGSVVWIPSFYYFQGFAIGNGLTDPSIQYKAYPDYALDMGLITQSQFNTITKIVPACEFAVKLCGNSWTPGLVYHWYPITCMYIAQIGRASCRERVYVLV